LLTNCYCKCGRQFKEGNIVVYTRGIASSVNVFCDCNLILSCKATKVSVAAGSDKLASSKLKRKTANDGHLEGREPHDLAIRDYDLNCKLVMGVQRTGAGECAAKTITSFLGLAPNGFDHAWQGIEQIIAQNEIALTKTILDENLEAEKKASPTRRGKPLLSIACDCG